MYSIISSDYLPVMVFLIISLGLAFVISVLPFLVARGKKSRSKLSRYECGFEAFDKCRSQFDIRFYLVSIIFIIFDLEIAFLFPWAIGLESIGSFGFLSMMIFLFVLTIGFIYEWKKGALDWE